MSLRNPLAKARGLGSAKDGTAHWWAQRVSAIALVPLVLYVLYLLVSLAGADYATVRLTIAQPVNALLLILFIGTAFWHARLGLQVVIEDYIHVGWLEITLMIAVKFVYVVLGLAAVIAIGRIAFSA
ncbi:succinate dehydrogenase, hydrophobic membrane anchor protein [uncultured Aquimonas sp.]|jgi:succinate dehydrogenase / fumarate reductase membrane anchor subunit|uniref:succinate dehydrogenase, hydrophobic membrane anchor protein n=1 Tax=uncultured Aquimonas sp. TaxID=385483 RepID=UPI00086C7B20|nr:succinate dehydrogenase, hydrophobic membrane anchor protein [uncultured Aquimonas sp.]ODU45476.1 MAG: succinate dehydrogenase, hydrophobic membrane anchor protein [Xanthomonadaceae bacterium SCN 69-123]